MLTDVVAAGPGARDEMVSRSSVRAQFGLDIFRDTSSNFPPRLVNRALKTMIVLKVAVAMVLRRPPIDRSPGVRKIC